MRIENVSSNAFFWKYILFNLNESREDEEKNRNFKHHKHTSDSQKAYFGVSSQIYILIRHIHRNCKANICILFVKDFLFINADNR